MTEQTLAAGAATAENPASGGDDAAAQAAAAAAAAAAAGGEGKGGKDGTGEGDAAATAAAAAAKAAEDGGGEDGPWGKDWRDKLAKGDAKRLERLARFASPEALLQAQEEAQRKISEGLKPKGKPGEKATDADWAAYRKEQGIPDAVDDYVKAIVLPDKRQIGDEDRPIVAAFADRAIKKGIAPADMTEMVAEYYDLQEEMQLQQATTDATFKKAAAKALKEEWGGDFDGNIAAMRPYFESVNPELFDNLMGGRLADGSKIGDHPDVVKFFATKAVAENPMATVLPTNPAGAETLNAEIAKYEARMSEDRVAWHRDTAAQERYRQLITARDKLKA